MADAASLVAPRIEPDDARPGRYRLYGQLTAMTISPIETTNFAAGDDGIVHIDLSSVEFADSAAVALMLGWIDTIDKQGSSVRFESMPPRLQSLIEVTGLSAVFNRSQ